ncbi:hypothetical protein GCM10009613_19210 [Pseudonocardia kongjuensis]|uniref:Uncharacterized protein n=1 Tax=Pseudonocardia kongjuensis TaxID=102227 RepID=A0ABP4IAQ9_9PSEU
MGGVPAGLPGSCAGRAARQLCRAGLSGRRARWACPGRCPLWDLLEVCPVCLPGEVPRWDPLQVCPVGPPGTPLEAWPVGPASGGVAGGSGREVCRVARPGPVRAGHPGPPAGAGPGRGGPVAAERSCGVGCAGDPAAAPPRGPVGGAGAVARAGPVVASHRAGVAP